MAQDNEIQILIKAVDEVTATMKNIESELSKSSKNIEKTTQATSDAFKEQTGSLLVLGNAAQQVDNIQSQYVNLQLRLENSTERVRNAQDRLSDAQTKLSRLQASGNVSAEQLTDAQNELTRATRGLNIAENNLERTQGQVVGTWLSMGTSAVSLIASLPKLIASINALTVSSAAFVATPIGLALLALGTAATAAAIGTNQARTAAENYLGAVDEWISANDQMDSSWTALNDKVAIFNTALEKAKSTLMGFVSQDSVEELQNTAALLDAKVKIAEAESRIAEIEAQSTDVATLKRLVKAGAATEEQQAALDKIQAIQSEIGKEDLLIKKLQAKKEVFDAQEAGAKARIDLEEANKKTEMGLYDEVNAHAKLSYADQLKYVQENFYTVLEQAQTDINNKLKLKYEEDATAYVNATEKKIAAEKRLQELRERGIYSGGTPTPNTSSTTTYQGPQWAIPGVTGNGREIERANLVN